MEELGKSAEHSVKNTLKEFAQDTICHGIGGIVRTKHMAIKILWSLIVISAMGTMLFQVAELFRLYFQHKLKTHSDFASPGFTEFPSVTVCNKNPVRKSALENADGPGFTLLKLKYQAMDSFDMEVTERLNSSHQASIETKDFYQNRDEYRKQVEHLWYDDLRFIGHKKENLIHRCVFRGSACDASNFSHQISPAYGNCYTFNSNELLQQPLGTWNHGAVGGLELILNIEHLEYVPYVSHGYGARVTIHEFGTFAFVEADGISVSPGLRIHTHLNLINMKRHHWSCSDDEQVQVKDFEKQYKKKYTTKTCELMTFLQLVFVECKCQLGVLELPLKRQSNEAYCNETKETRICVENMQQQILNGGPIGQRLIKLNEECKKPCKENIFEVSLSSSKWPQHSTLKFLTLEACQRTKTINTSVACAIPSENINFINLVVSFDSIRYEKMEEVLDFPLSGLQANVGGTLGLWAGISMLTLPEVVLLIIALIRLLKRKRVREKEARKQRVGNDEAIKGGDHQMEQAQSA